MLGRRPRNRKRGVDRRMGRLWTESCLGPHAGRDVPTAHTTRPDKANNHVNTSRGARPRKARAQGALKTAGKTVPEMKKAARRRPFCQVIRDYLEAASEAAEAASEAAEAAGAATSEAAEATAATEAAEAALAASSAFLVQAARDTAAIREASSSDFFITCSSKNKGSNNYR